MTVHSKKFTLNKSLFILIILFLLLIINILSYNFLIKTFIDIEQSNNNKKLLLLSKNLDSQFHRLDIKANFLKTSITFNENIYDKNNFFVRYLLEDLEFENNSFKLIIHNKKITFSQIDNTNLKLNEDIFFKHILYKIEDINESAIVNIGSFFYFIKKIEVNKNNNNFSIILAEELNPSENNNFFNKLYYSNFEYKKYTNKILTDYIDNILVETIKNKNELINKLNIDVDSYKTIIYMKNKRDIYLKGRDNILIYQCSISALFMITVILLINKLYKQKNKYLKLKSKSKEEFSKLKKHEQILRQQSKMALMGEMIGYISHQWRQPLNRINGLNHILYNHIENETYDRKKFIECFNNIEKNTTYLSQTIEYFLNFFNINEKKQTYLIDDILYRSIELIQQNTEGIDIEIDSNKNCYIKTSEQELTQVFLIILNNAIENFKIKNIKYPSIQISISKKKEITKIKISDNGGGINKDEINKIFDIWYSTKKDSNAVGVGVGLYMARFIVENAFGGEINVEVNKRITNFEIIIKGNKNV